MTLRIKVKQGWAEEAPDVQTVVMPDGKTVVLRREEVDPSLLLASQSKEESDAAHLATLDMFAQNLGSNDSARVPVTLSPNPTSGGVTSVAVVPPKPSSVGGLGILFELELWRADLLTAVLELDSSGHILMGGLTNPLSPPGEQLCIFNSLGWLDELNVMRNGHHIGSRVSFALWNLP